jgi:hypothetical protein
MRTDKSGNPLQRLVGASGDQSILPSPATPRPAAREPEENGHTHGAAPSPAADLGQAGDGRSDVDDRAKQAGLKTTGTTASAEAALEALTPAIEHAQAFAERWPVTYRPEIFRAALAHLLGDAGADGLANGVAADGGLGGHVRRGRAAQGSVQTTHGATADVGGILPNHPAHRVAGGTVGPIEKLARALGVDADAVERTVHIDEDGRISILGRLAGKARKELQTRYSLVYLYVKEMGLGVRMVDIEELRALCIEHGCYDQANFTGNYKKDVTAGLIREDGGKGTRARRYMLSQKGVAEGNSVLRTMVEQ